MPESREFEEIDVGEGHETVDALVGEALGRVGGVVERVRLHDPDDVATVEFPQTGGLRFVVSKAAMGTLAAQAAELGAGRPSSNAITSSASLDAMERWAAAYASGMDEGNGE